jgi:hypothetical protein
MWKYTKLNIILHSVSLFRGLYLMVQSSSQNSSCRCMREGNFKTHMFINRENFALPKKFGPYLVWTQNLTMHAPENGFANMFV